MADRLDRILDLCRARVPGIRLRPKSEVAWMRALGVVLRPVNGHFATRYTTVLGRTVYLPAHPDDMDRDRLAATLAHELVHQLDMRRWGPLFYASYGFALPAARTYRAHWERRAYAVDLMISHDQGGPARLDATARELAALFASPEYLWMWAGRRAAFRYLAPVVEAVRTGELQRQEPYREILGRVAWSPSCEYPRLNADFVVEQRHAPRTGTRLRSLPGPP